MTHESNPNRATAAQQNYTAQDIAAAHERGIAEGLKRAAPVPASTGRELIYQRQEVNGAWRDTTLLGYEGWRSNGGSVRTVYAAPVAARELDADAERRASVLDDEHVADCWRLAAGDWRKFARDIERRAIRATAESAPASAAPDEQWKMVPINPTPKMIDATFNDRVEGESHNARNRRIYAAMVAAAPKHEHVTPPFAAPAGQPDADARDAARYRWVRDSANCEGPNYVGMYADDDLDEKIDEAIIGAQI